MAQDALISARNTLAAEAAGLTQLADALGDNFIKAVDLLANAKGRVIISGMGKSGHIGNKIAATMASTGTPASFVHPAEASHGDLGMITPDDVVLALSWSGSTQELASLLNYTKRFNIPLVAITSSEDSLLGKAATICLTLPKAKEACPNGLAPTTSTTMQLALGDALAVALLEQRNFSAADFKNFHPGGKLGANLSRVADIMHQGDALPLIDGSMKMAEAIVLMTEKGFGCLGIIDEAENLRGVITDGDLRRHMADDLLARTASDIMTTDPQIIGGDKMTAEALSLMQENKVQCLFVCAEGKPTGLIRVLDLLRLGTA
ncbi:KpsF/GutQ family sugar-phosphate isomerase [Alphaproteobacteria bacterium]|nr:KpsF/GutQ family sugar-phosphate isomerase [bacterium]MDA8642602.1 KpsF/GutQ family sugar-phosphate isomerase [Alphaproteobacteria bacterium]MDA8667017.1 KpsF/GutQ family sugar-phosphate isomerase [Alphaproteobacteria bacterium]MDB2461958.1 KpsF/GutQ family sugar-phosphate isomerase [Alphaproteobacteria bacterium]MDB2477052.1 KpsF/GutQ family sugar-phosphate isomerase [Alphaproteobacteria bacterium]